MKNLTKKERLGAYRMALNSPDFHWGICNVLLNDKFGKLESFGGKRKVSDFYKQVSQFKELMLFRPNGMSNKDFWFEDTQERRMVLQLCIEMAS